MNSKTLLGCLLLSVAAPLAACGGGTPKVDTAKMSTVHKVAIVGVCTKSNTLSGIAGTKTGFEVEWGEQLVPHEAAGVESALPVAWRGVEIMPLTAVVKTADLPKGGANASGRICFGGVDPLDKDDEPDRALMKQLAATLKVDAVLAIWSGPGVRSDGSKAHMYTGLGAGAYAYVVDKNGDLVVTAALDGVDSAEIEKLLSVGAASTDQRKVSPEEIRILGTSFGEALAKKLGSGLSGK